MDDRRRLKQCASLLLLTCLERLVWIVYEGMIGLDWIGLYLVLLSCIWYNMRSDSIN